MFEIPSGQATARPRWDSLQRSLSAAPPKISWTALCFDVRGAHNIISLFKSAKTNRVSAASSLTASGTATALAKSVAVVWRIGCLG